MKPIEIYRCREVWVTRVLSRSKSGRREESVTLVPGSYYRGEDIDRADIEFLPRDDYPFERVGFGPEWPEIKTREDLVVGCESIRLWIAGDMAKELEWNPEPKMTQGTKLKETLVVGGPTMRHRSEPCDKKMPDPFQLTARRVVIESATRLREHAIVRLKLSNPPDVSMIDSEVDAYAWLNQIEELATPRKPEVTCKTPSDEPRKPGRKRRSEKDAPALTLDALAYWHKYKNGKVDNWNKASNRKLAAFWNKGRPVKEHISGNALSLFLAQRWTEEEQRERSAKDRYWDACDEYTIDGLITLWKGKLTKEYLQG